MLHCVKWVLCKLCNFSSAVELKETGKVFRGCSSIRRSKILVVCVFGRLGHRRCRSFRILVWATWVIQISGSMMTAILSQILAKLNRAIESCWLYYDQCMSAFISVWCLSWELLWDYLVSLERSCLWQLQPATSWLISEFAQRCYFFCVFLVQNMLF